MVRNLRGIFHRGINEATGYEKDPESSARRFESAARTLQLRLDVLAPGLLILAQPCLVSYAARGGM